MKLFFSYNDDYKDLTENIFLPSLKDDFELCPVKIKNFDLKWQIAGGEEGNEMRKNLINHALTKTEHEELFIVSDTDIKFYKPVMGLIKEESLKTQNVFENNLESQKIDLFFQKENESHECNMGFMVMRNNEKIKYFWDDVYRLSYNSWDQFWVNELLHKNTITNLDKNILIYKNNTPRWSRLPDSIWNWSMGKSGVLINKEVHLHHANCAILKEEKIKQFEYVESCLRNDIALDYSIEWMK